MSEHGYSRGYTPFMRFYYTSPHMATQGFLHT
jgi:hypothetical protein